MSLYYEDGGLALYHGSNKDILPTFDAESFDSIVTDPPYELGFMGKGWDSSGIAYDVDMWRECWRVLKPGGYLLAFGGTRTWHRIATAIEDAGFEIRDSMAWLYGSGFPKSMDVSKAIEKSRNDGADWRQVGGWLKARREEAGFTRQSIAPLLSNHRNIDSAAANMSNWENGLGFPTLDRWDELRQILDFDDEMDAEVLRLNLRKGESGEAWKARAVSGQHVSGLSTGTSGVGGAGAGKERRDFATTDEAKAWEGWGTALKPAFEPIIVARKPLRGNVAANVLAYGTGAINIDANRVPMSAEDAGRIEAMGGFGRGGYTRLRTAETFMQGTPEATAARAHEGGRWPTNVVLDESQAALLDAQSGTLTSGKVQPHHADNGKAEGTLGAFAGAPGRESYGDAGGASRFFPTFRYEAKAPSSERPEVDGVAHATVKPLDLMRWLVRLVTRRGGRVLDPFAGSGTTGEAALLEGMEAVLIELEETHLPLILQRVRKPLQPSMFGDWEETA